MSMRHQEKNYVTGGAVIVRAYDEQPVRLRAMAVVNGMVEVASDDGEASINFPIESVFRYDEKIFVALNEAYRKRHRKHLQKLWGSAQPFVPTTPNAA